MPRIAVLSRDRCKKERCGYICAKYCPVNRMGGEAIRIDEKGYPVIDEGLCTGCGICVKKCPTKAIKVVNLAEERGTMIHSYGVNSFRLYNFPLPREGSVVGLIGRNGLGKSTAVKIIFGLIKPNLGKEHASFDEVIEAFRGNELQNFFQRLKEGEIIASYKPQEVDRIPEVFKGLVRDLLERVGNVEEIAEKYGITHLLDRNVQQLSGGELQKLAIIACIEKKANLYLLDEPSSFLDVKERLEMAKRIREKKHEGSVLVVEHDLAVLDYLSDYVHVFFGVPGVYGVVSQIKGVRVGINEYLQGYLREENVRIRDKAVTFELKSPEKLKKRKIISVWPSFEKRYETFTLKAEQGDIREGEVLGLIGPNGIGKSTFVKVLAGVEKAEPCFDLGFELSYKPQYLRGVLKGVVQDNLPSGEVIGRKEIIERLEIEELLERPVDELSGGELQKVMIARCLLKEAKIYLLDEPSAFLDVETRLRVAKLIRNVVDKRKSVAFVVDHDLVFLDMICDRLIVFEGEPGIEGHALSPKGMREGMNLFLSSVGVTFRRDKETKRPRANKPGSRLDRLQKEMGEYYYFGT